MNFRFATRGVCSRAIEIDIEGNILKSVHFSGGCNGNTKGIAALVEGMSIDDVIKRLDGIDCGGRGTSCPDQLSTALKKIKEQMQEG